MNIQAISGMNFMAKPTQIKRVTPLSDYAELLLKGAREFSDYQRKHFNVKCEEPAISLIEEAQQVAQNYGREVVKLAQSGDMLLINSGNITSSFKLNPVLNAEEFKKLNEIVPNQYLEDVSRSLLETFRTNVKGNVIAEERGLKKGIEYIEINKPQETVGSKLNIVG